MSTGFILTRSQGGSTGSSSSSFGTKPPPITILPTETKDVDIIPFTTFAAAKWLVTVLDTDSSTYFQSYEVHGHFMSSKPVPTHTTHSLIGDKIKTIATVVVSGGSLKLQIQNNETFTVSVSVARYEVST